MSGSINNDALSLVLAVLSVYLVILWYKAPSFRLIIMLAISIGLSMMAKLSGGTVAPAVAALFLLKLVKDREHTGRYILQYLVFGIIVFPLGIWWEIKNMMLYGMPFNYIPPVGEQLKASMLMRLFDIRTGNIYPCLISNGDAYDEYNVWLAMLKTSLFDDANLGMEAGGINLFAFVLFITALVLAIASLIATVKVLADKKNRYALLPEHKLLFGVLYLTLLISYFSFALGSNNYSAMSFRYIALVIVVESVFLGVFTDACTDKHHIRFRLFAATLFAFAASSLSAYLLLGFAR
jgi:hypothetical protein